MPGTPEKICRVRPQFSISLIVVLYILMGLIQMVLAYLLFSRADDHEYFLSLANNGLSVIPTFDQEWFDIKVHARGAIFFFVTAPSRLLGGNELVHLLWLRFLALIGFWCCFEFLQKSLAPKISHLEKKSAMTTFFVMCLLYPGQLAWSSSLLRDGVATALLMASLLAFSLRHFKLFAPVLLIATLALRPEYGLIVIFLMCGFYMRSVLAKFKYRLLLLLIILVFISIATYQFQVESSEFAQQVFGDGAFPAVADIFDIRGYCLKFLQGLVDPIFLSRVYMPGFFPVTEAIYFIIILCGGIKTIQKGNNQFASIVMAVLIVMWIFAYFELSVGGFSRHRLPIEIMLIGCIVLSKSKSIPAAPSNR